MQLYYGMNLAYYHMGYFVLCLVACKNWQVKHKERITEEKRFNERLMTRQITAKDWSRSMKSSNTITLLVGSLCPYRFAILGAVLIDKEISESTNYMNLSAKMKGSNFDEKLLRVLFESRIKQRLALQVPQEIVKELKRAYEKKQNDIIICTDDSTKTDGNSKVEDA